MSESNPKVDWYFKKNVEWKDEIGELRRIILDTGLTEELKWGCPCYTLDGANIVLIHCFKNYCAILFHQGALLKDAKSVLIQQTKNVQAARQMRFTNIAEVESLEPTIKSYIREAIKLEKAGVKVQLKKELDPLPEELMRKMKELPALKKAFNALTPGRQRGYILYFSSAKQAKTREARVEKYLQNIFDGKGFDE